MAALADGGLGTGLGWDSGLPLSNSPSSSRRLGCTFYTVAGFQEEMGGCKALWPGLGSHIMIKSSQRVKAGLDSRTPPLNGRGCKDSLAVFNLSQALETEKREDSD